MAEPSFGESQVLIDLPHEPLRHTSTHWLRTRLSLDTHWLCTTLSLDTAVNTTYADVTAVLGSAAVSPWSLFTPSGRSSSS